jgi:PST family polysaccharide transporter
VSAVPKRIGSLLEDSPEGNSTFSGNVVWASLSNGALQAAQFVAFIALAHLLMPASFGVAAVAMVIVNFAQILTDLGVGSALIQLPAPTRAHLAAAFQLNLLSGFVLTGVVWAMSDPLASAFSEPSLAGVLRLASVIFTVSDAIVQVGLLERAHRFRTLAFMEGGCAVAGYALAVGLAASGFGVRSLVIGPVVSAALLTLIAWARYPFFTLRPAPRAAYQAIWQRGWGFTGFQLFNYWGRNADNLLLGLTASATDLGWYARAYSFMLAPIAQVTSALSRVLLPSLARMRPGEKPFKMLYLRTLRFSALLFFPISLGLAAVSRTFVFSVLGHPWNGMVPILFWLSVSGPAQVVSGSAGAVYQAASRTAQLFRRGLVVSACTIAAIVCGLPWGGEGVAIALCARFFVVLPVGIGPTLKLARISWIELLRALSGVILASALMATGEYVWAQLAQPTLGLQACEVGTGAAFYAIAIRILDKQLVHDAAEMFTRWWTARPSSSRPHRTAPEVTEPAVR